MAEENKSLEAMFASLEEVIQKLEQNEISLEVSLVKSVNAPVKKGDTLGEIRVMQKGEIVQRIPAAAGETVELPGMVHALVRIRDRFMLSN